ncbi:putative metallopeptidase [Patescibacteria group bacterium]
MNFQKAPDIQKKLNHLLDNIEFPHIDRNRIIAFRSEGSKANARARIWSMPRIWQLALNIKAHYVIEVISHHFDHLNEDEQLKVLIHELMHIPKSFSGALVPHRGAGRRHQVHHTLVNKLFKEYKKKTGKGFINKLFSKQC